MRRHEGRGAEHALALGAPVHRVAVDAAAAGHPGRREPVVLGVLRCHVVAEGGPGNIQEFESVVKPGPKKSNNCMLVYLREVAIE